MLWHQPSPSLPARVPLLSTIAFLVRLVQLLSRIGCARTVAESLVDPTPYCGMSLSANGPGANTQVQVYTCQYPWHCGRGRHPTRTHVLVEFALQLSCKVQSADLSGLVEAHQLELWHTQNPRMDILHYTTPSATAAAAHQSTVLHTGTEMRTSSRGRPHKRGQMCGQGGIPLATTRRFPSYCESTDPISVTEW